MPEDKPKIYFVKDVVELLQSRGYFEITEEKIKVLIKEGILAPKRLNPGTKRSRYVYSEEDITGLQILSDFMLVLPKPIAVDYFHLCYWITRFELLLRDEELVQRLLSTPFDIHTEPWNNVFDHYTGIQGQAILLENAWETINKGINRMQLVQKSFFGVKEQIDEFNLKQIDENRNKILKILNDFLDTPIPKKE
jgi:hypothetical protein